MKDFAELKTVRDLVIYIFAAYPSKQGSTRSSNGRGMAVISLFVSFA
jgi:hypothetical protein